MLATALALALAAPAAVCTPTVQWTWDGPTASPAYPEPCITPLVLQLTDDDGDGDIDAADMPDVVFIHTSMAAYSGLITAVDGLTGAEHWSTGTPRVMPTALAAGDIDGDGLVEILAISDGGQTLLAFEHDGTPKWTSDPAPVALYEFDALGIADLDQDGQPELFVGASVWNGDGTFRWQGTAGSGTESYWNLISISHAADLLPANPGLELVAGNTAYAADGRVLWQNATLPDGWTAMADFDGDGRAEIVLTTPEEVYLLDDQGNVRAGPVIMPGTILSPPIAGDVDGDGLPEAIVIAAYELRVLEVTPTGFVTRWSATVNDDSRANSAATFDFDGDGAAEIVYHDAEQWYIFDGRTGAVLTPFLPFVSATTIETPVIADLDHDCAAEILVSGCQGGIPAISPQRVIAYECAPSRAARPMWNEYGYHVTNVNDDGTIPRVETAPWLAQNSWVGQVASGGGLVAEAGPPLTICGQVPVTLDGSASSTCATSATQYRWLEGAAIACDWSANPVCMVLPAGSPATYTLEIECAGLPGCTATDQVTVTTVVPPSAAAGPDRTVCVNATPLLDGLASLPGGCAGGLLYEWRQGATVLRPAGPDPTWTPPTAVPGTTTYTLAVTCAAAPSCAAGDDLVITVRTCTLAVRFGQVDAVRTGGTVAVTFRTLAEASTLGFVVERAPGREGPFAALAEPIAARGEGFPYRWLDASAPPSGEVWYRVVELTADGRGDESWPVLARAGAPAGTARSGRRRGTRAGP